VLQICNRSIVDDRKKDFELKVNRSAKKFR